MNKILGANICGSAQCSHTAPDSFSSCTTDFARCLMLFSLTFNEIKAPNLYIVYLKFYLSSLVIVWLFFSFWFCFFPSLCSSPVAIQAHAEGQSLQGLVFVQLHANSRVSCNTCNDSVFFSIFFNSSKFY